MAKKQDSTLALALAWREARTARLLAQKEVNKLELAEKELKDQVIAGLRKAKNKAVSNGDRLIQLVTKDEPTVEDWGSFYEHIKTTGAFELLYRRMNPAAVKERWDAKEKVPGVGSIPVETLSDTEAK